MASSSFDYSWLERRSRGGPDAPEVKEARPERMAIMEHDTDERATRRPGVGTPVEVRCTFDGVWAKGFELAATTPHGYRLRRVSDDYVLPGEFEIRLVRTIS
jgi:hypothetical protein